MENICIPIHLDAFAFSPDCCSGESTIAPYSQPNYVSLRLDSHLIQHDIQDHVDFHLARDPRKNPRLADLGSKDGATKVHRLGIHLHWTLPRFYRTADSIAQNSRPVADKSTVPDASQPKFRPMPNRWLIVRHTKSCEPANVLPTYQSWVIESNVWRKITDIPDSVDLESGVTPFVAYDGKPDDKMAINNQAEVFLGNKYSLSDWKEDPSRKYINPLTVMNSSNPLFPDFALQNTNVLSMIDNLGYVKDNKIGYCSKASVNYYVIGWHKDNAEDPLTRIPGKESYQNFLSKLLLKLNLGPDATKDVSARTHNDSVSPTERFTRCLCHGAVYDVQWNKDKKPQSLADDAAKKFTSDFKMEPLSVGTTVLDGILTFLEAHKENAEATFGKGTSNIANDLLQISTLLFAVGDDYDSRVQAQDLIAQQNFKKSDGGSQWVYNQQVKAGSAPATPSDDDKKKLRQLNEAQTKLDALSRKLRYTQWDLFAEWWKFVSDYIPPEKRSERYGPLRNKVADIKKICAKLADQCRILQNDKDKSVDALANVVASKKASKSQYFQKTDPSLCIAGLDSGFPTDFMDVLQVSEDHQHVQDFSAAKDVFKGPNNKDLPSPFPTGDQANKLGDTAMRVLSEYIKKSGEQNILLTTGSQTWGNRNPFIPLFVEWEGVYYHIDNDKHDAWEIQVRTSPVGHPNPQVRYGTKSNLSSDATTQTDTRIVSGRILILPQPTFNLEAVVMQVLDNDSSDIALTDAQKQDIRNNIRKLKFISAPLGGLTSHLITRCEGAHVKPNVRVQGETAIPLQVAIDAIDADGGLAMGRDGLAMVNAESALTPYGSLLEFNTDKVPFKPVTQGQMIFTKLNIIDKFGQAVCLPLPKPRLKMPTAPPSANIFPCMSDYLTPDIRNGKHNVIFDLPGPLTQYMQLEPSINQDSRINVAFLVRDETPGTTVPWRVASDYETPVFGWIIINYADYGLQFFLKDGTFYQEIRKGGAFGTNTSAKYIPFKPAKAPVVDAASLQLDALINLFSSKNDPKGEYLQTFFDMINGAIKTLPFPPSSYAGYASAIVGKPLALVNAGFSLELSTPALTAQNTLGKTVSAQNAAYKQIVKDHQTSLSSYKFPIKIGDASRTFDGVVGYYDVPNKPTPSPQSDITTWSTLFSYFGLPAPNDPVLNPNPAPLPSPSAIQPIAPSTFPLLSPYYLDPEDYLDPRATPDMTTAAAAQLMVKALLIDPYTSLHAYSPILPTTTLKLPDWTVQTAFEKMSAFFRLGPSLVVTDVPSTYALATPAVLVQLPGALPIAPPPMPTISLPMAGKKGTWTWLQPYEQEGKEADGAGKQAQFATLEVLEDAGKGKFAPGPYTFVEGYLQLVGNLGREEAKSLAGK